jgi:ribosomal protein L37E
MTDDRNTNASKRIKAGWLLGALSLLLLLYGGFNIVKTPAIDGIPPLVPLACLVIGGVVLILGVLLLVDGWTARWQIEMQDRQDGRESAVSRMGGEPPERDSAHAPAAPARAERGRPDHDHISDATPIPGRDSLEEPTTKKCPGCGKSVYKDARVCRYCGRAFTATLRLKVYPPQEKDKREHVVELLATRLKMPAEDVAHLLEMGMRFKYDSPEKLAAARGKFEALGCATEVYEKVGKE